MIGTLHIVLAMKPTQGNFAENAIAFGVAGINVDGTRVRGPKGDGVWGTSNATINTERKFNASPSMTEYRSEQNTLGRFPANVILSHAEACVLKGAKRVKSDGHHSYKLPDDGGLYELGLNNLDDKGNPHADAEGKETVEDWECSESCPVKKLGEQSGESESTNNPRRCQPSESIGTFKTHYRETQGHGDTGTAARFFHTVGEFILDEA